MKAYIDKTALVAEIKELIRANELYLSKPETDEIKFQKTGAYSVLNDLLHSIDTIEVKEVEEEPVSKDLEEELIKWHNNHFRKENTFVGMSGFYLTNNSQLSLAHHFAQWQKEKLIDKACKWLDGVIYDYIELKHTNVDTLMEVDNDKFINDFRKAMEE